MYSLLISAAVALVVALGGFFSDVWGWFGAILMALLAFVVSWILLGFRLRKRIGPALERVRKQTEKGMYRSALETIDDLLPMGRWMPLLTGQLQAQRGALAFADGKESVALEAFALATKRATEAQLLRAALLWRRDEKELAQQVLGEAEPYNRKSSLLFNARAWMLVKLDREAEARACLGRFLKKVPDNEATKDNLLRLQNDRKLNLQRFGQEWWALGLERPPAQMGEVRQGRKGFRQAPKNPGKRSPGGKKK